MSTFFLLAGALLGWAVLLIAAERWCFAWGYWQRARRGAPATDPSPAQPTRFAVLIPAHDEELLIGAAVDSVFAANYPREALAVYVIADHCSDRTAELARGRGAHVLERLGAPERGKGAALAAAIEQLDFSGSDAVVIADADVLIGRDFFAAMHREFARGARVLQGYDDLSNPDESMLTRLMAITFAQKNLLYNAGKAALGFSPLFQGKGMVFERELLRSRGWRARGLSEDIEEALRWVADGYRICFVADAPSYAQEAASLDQARTQRERWAGGSRQLRAPAWRALREALARRDAVLGEAALSVLLPNYSKHLNFTLLAGVLVGVGALLARALPPLWAWAPAALALALQLAEFAAALRLARAGWRHAAALLLAPAFLVWKAALDLRVALGGPRTAWVRTARHAQR